MTATTTSAAPARPALHPAALRSAVATEWLKLRTVRSTWWFLGGSAAVILLLAVLETNNHDPATVGALTPVLAAVNYFVQYILAAFGMVAITSEFVTRSITVTVASTPSRTRVLTSKALVVGAVTFVASTVAAGAAFLVGAARFGELADLGQAEVGIIVRAGAFLAALAVLSLGIGTLVRRTAGALAIMLLLLLMVPELLRLLSQKTGQAWIDTLGDWTPSPIGWRFMEGDLADGWALLAWAVAAVTAGIWVLRARDV